MKSILQNGKQKLSSQGLCVRSSMRAGKVLIGSKDAFNYSFLRSAIHQCGEDTLSTALNETNDLCKATNKSGKQCDKWASTYGLPFAHG